ncbi:hypothetical protein Xbed_02014 [Xenorhabdus beddingii]|uniref:CYTH domain-containing protein n=1 Tax=Xenorhabdus beddingii TaxID=40578 RepID=A0A1Y2SLV6_9GAMM|nr:CYTH domain-containing protein [Xenorhabdus beddingii]OTA19890.1 hypothetical protein Xbed_02014 [Xenorhabdus beddingii]
MSSVEIELKLSVKSDAISAARQQLFQFSHHHSSPKHLTNIYFETPDNQLRRWDMGLRIRGFDGHYEMTIKTAGNVVGGLHQRPEFNVPLHQPELDLAQFPAHIWPEHTDLAHLQAELTELFSTDFTREKWLLMYGQSEIEVVLDQGSVCSGNKRSGNKYSENRPAGERISPICEFELELINGNVTDILSLANQLASQNGLRLANKSKAARGYALAHGLPHKPLPSVPDELEWQQPLSVLLTEILAQWQEQEEGWLAGLNEGKTGLVQVLHWVMQLTEKQAGYLSAVGRLPDLLPGLKAGLSTASAEAETVCYSASWLQCKLALTQCLVDQSQ